MSSISKLNARDMRVVEECGKLYNFDSSDAVRLLSEVLNKKEKKESVKYPMPFNGKKNEGCCSGIVKNHGLYTQCEKKVKENEYCKVCEKKTYGSIEDRLSKDLYEYKDPKGKCPKRYTEVLKKLNISKETIEKEAERLNIKINPIHFEEVSENVKRGRPKTEKKVKEVSGKKGRPKKEKKTVVVNNNEEEEDLFATLIANAYVNEKEAIEKEESKVEKVAEVVTVTAEEVVAKEESKPKKAKKVKEVDPAKEAEKQKKAEEKAAKEAEKQKKAEEKAAKEAEKQKKAEEKAAKEAEKQKKAEEKAAKEAEKQNVEEEADVVRKFDFEGKSYYKSKKSGVIYNMDQEVVGKWNEERNEIDFDEEEEEEEYDE